MEFKLQLLRTSISISSRIHQNSIKTLSIHRNFEKLFKNGF